MTLNITTKCNNNVFIVYYIITILYLQFLICIHSFNFVNAFNVNYNSNVILRQHNHQKQIYKYIKQSTKNNYNINEMCLNQYINSNEINPIQTTSNNEDTATTTTTTSSANNNVNNNNNIITIPIFPLRKKVRVPTEKLYLNLYEMRYLYMIDYILSNQKQNNTIIINNNNNNKNIFGTIYTSNKPQLIQNNGMGDIVPIIQKNDIGVLFIIDELIDDVIINSNDNNNNNNNDDSNDSNCNNALSQQRIIRLKSRGILRFKIVNILSNGSNKVSNIGNTNYDNNNDNDNDNDISQLPFILAQVEIITDNGFNLDIIDRTNLINKIQQSKSILLTLPKTNFFSLFFQKNKDINNDNDNKENENKNNKNDDNNYNNIESESNDIVISTNEIQTLCEDISNVLLLYNIWSNDNVNNNNDFEKRLLEYELLSYILCSIQTSYIDSEKRIELLDIVDTKTRIQSLS